MQIIDNVGKTAATGTATADPAAGSLNVVIAVTKSLMRGMEVATHTPRSGHGTRLPENFVQAG